MADRVTRTPGVESVAWASNMPLFARPLAGLQVEGRPRQSPADQWTTIVNTVSLGYFKTSGIAIRSGRDFGDLDRSTSIPVAIVNEQFARDYWPGKNALGKRLLVPGEHQMRQIVGVARTANYSSWGEPPQRCVYVPLEQNPLPAMTLYVRSTGEPEQMVGTGPSRDTCCRAASVGERRQDWTAGDRRRPLSGENRRGAPERVWPAVARPGQPRASTAFSRMP